MPEIEATIPLKQGYRPSRHRQFQMKGEREQATMKMPRFVLACQKLTFKNKVDFQPKYFHVCSRTKVT